MKEEITKLVNEGLSYSQIGKKLSISKQRVHQIFREYNSSNNWAIKKLESLNKNPVFLRDIYKLFDS